MPPAAGVSTGRAPPAGGPAGADVPGAAGGAPAGGGPVGAAGFGPGVVAAPGVPAAAPVRSPAGVTAAAGPPAGPASGVGEGPAVGDGPAVAAIAGRAVGRGAATTGVRVSVGALSQIPRRASRASRS